jgi:hypothetical protein
MGSMAFATEQGSVASEQTESCSHEISMSDSAVGFQLDTQIQTEDLTAAEEITRGLPCKFDYQCPIGKRCFAGYCM